MISPHSRRSGGSRAQPCADQLKVPVEDVKPVTLTPKKRRLPRKPR